MIHTTLRATDIAVVISHAQYGGEFRIAIKTVCHTVDQVVAADAKTHGVITAPTGTIDNGLNDVFDVRGLHHLRIAPGLRHPVDGGGGAAAAGDVRRCGRKCRRIITVKPLYGQAVNECIAAALGRHKFDHRAGNGSPLRNTHIPEPQPYGLLARRAHAVTHIQLGGQGIAGVVTVDFALGTAGLIGLQ